MQVSLIPSQSVRTLAKRQTGLTLLCSLLFALQNRSFEPFEQLQLGKLHQYRAIETGDISHLDTAHGILIQVRATQSDHLCDLAFTEMKKLLFRQTSQTSISSAMASGKLTLSRLF